jgi:hypothetical protein
VLVVRPVAIEVFVGRGVRAGMVAGYSLDVTLVLVLGGA